MTRVLRFTNDQSGTNRMRFIHQGLSQSPLASKLDEMQTRRYVALLTRLEEASVPDPEMQPPGELDYWPRIMAADADVTVTSDEINQIAEFCLSAPFWGWLKRHVLAAVDWARTAPAAE